ncbi:MAG: RsmB/NOP family class I SAM-dependent RNA methyltransferase [Pseudomonadota bacterium]
MRLGGRIAAAIEVLDTVETRHVPPVDALKDWGWAHRFAGSGDRAVIGNLVFDCLRWRASSAWLMGSETARALMLATLVRHWDMPIDQLVTALADDPYAPAPLSDAERMALSSNGLDRAPDWVRGDYPEWLAGEFVTVFGDEAANEGQGLSTRAPLDLRVNTLKSDRPKALKALTHLKAEATPLSPWGIRVHHGAGPQRQPSAQAEAVYRKGHVEVQDEGSQLAALLSGAKPGWQVLDLCAGGGGKTLALAQMLANSGQIYAYDADRKRLANIHERLQRAGVRAVQVRDPIRPDALADLSGRMDLVLIDAPCSGSGTWRRRPDTKWRLTEQALEKRVTEQDTVLRQAVEALKPGGRLVYVTCSVLRRENDDRVAALCDATPSLTPISMDDLIGDVFPGAAGDRLRACVLPTRFGLQMTPRRTGCDGFYVAALQQQG